MLKHGKVAIETACSGLDRAYEAGGFPVQDLLEEAKILSMYILHDNGVEIPPLAEVIIRPDCFVVAEPEAPLKTTSRILVTLGVYEDGRPIGSLRLTRGRSENPDGVYFLINALGEGYPITKDLFDLLGNVAVHRTHLN